MALPLPPACSLTLSSSVTGFRITNNLSCRRRTKTKCQIFFIKPKPEELPDTCRWENRPTSQDYSSWEDATNRPGRVKWLGGEQLHSVPWGLQQKRRECDEADSALPQGWVERNGCRVAEEPVQVIFSVPSFNQLLQTEKTLLISIVAKRERFCLE